MSEFAGVTSSGFVVLDWDGTIVDSQYLIHTVMSAALTAHDAPAPTLDAVRSVVGLELSEAIGRLLPMDFGGDLAEVVGVYRETFALERAKPDCEEPFTTVQTADDAPGKPHPGMLEQAMAHVGANKSETVMIGDTTFDMEMAGNAGVRAIGVAWGYHTVEALRAAGAARIVEGFAEIPAAVNEMIAT
jgi:phosphoglycolate phosphatase